MIAEINSLPGCLRQDGRRDTFAIDRSDGDEIAVLPLTAEPQLAQLVVLHLHLAQDGLERAGRQFVRHRVAVEAVALDRLLQHLQAGIGDHRTPEIRSLAGHFLMALAIGGVGLVVRIDTAEAHDALGILAVVLAIGREAGADAEIEHLRIELRHLGLLRQGEGFRRIGEGDEGVGTLRCRFRQDRREVRRADRIGDVVDHFQPGLVEGRTRGADEVDAEAVGDRDHRHLLVDRAGIRRLDQKGGQCLGIVMAAAEHPEAPLPALDEIGSLVGDCGDGELRVAEAIEQRCHCKIEAGAPRRQDEIDLVLVGEALDGAYHFFRRGTVVVFDHLDRQALAARQFQAAGVVDLLDPEFVVRNGGDARAAGIGAGLRDRVADLHGCRFLREGRHGYGYGAKCGAHAKIAQGAPAINSRHLIVLPIRGRLLNRPMRQMVLRSLTVPS